MRGIFAPNSVKVLPPSIPHFVSGSDRVMACHCVEHWFFLTFGKVYIGVSPMLWNKQDELIHDSIRDTKSQINSHMAWYLANKLNYADYFTISI